jgi:hypothetical protein
LSISRDILKYEEYLYDDKLLGRGLAINGKILLL